MVTRKRYVNHVKYVCFVSLCEPKNVKEALLDEFWIKAMHEELEQFSRMFRLLYLDLKILMLLVPNGYLKINLMNLVTLLGIRLGWSPKDTHKLRVLILMRHLLLLLS